MKFKLWSDIHNEFGSFLRPESKKDKKHILLLAGDVDVWGARKGRQLRQYIKIMSKRYKKVISVAGNHEYYGSSIERVDRKMRSISVGSEEFPAVENYHFLQNDTVKLEENNETVYVIGSTLWTDMDKGSPAVKWKAANTMNDFKTIRYKDNFRKFTPCDSVLLHMKARDYIKAELIRIRKEDENAKIVVMTHHGPCSLSSDSKYAGDDLNFAYYTDLSEMILDYEPNVWVHGHMHNSSDYVLGKTRIIANPRGYVGHELNKNFKEDFTFEL